MSLGQLQARWLRECVMRFEVFHPELTTYDSTPGQK